MNMYTYNDLLDVGKNEKDRMEFARKAIRRHEATERYKIARDAELYYKQLNPTIMLHQKFLHNRYGQKVPNLWCANNKIASNWYNYFVTQSVSYLLGNGVTFRDAMTKKKLGKQIDRRLYDLAIKAKNGSSSFGFWNYDHLEIFGFTEFAPLYDEDTGGLMAGVRYWQIDESKPLRMTLYETDGYTDYIKRRDEDVSVLIPKRKYIHRVQVSGIGDDIILDGDNYPSFPILPMWNINKQSELVGRRGLIDAYDLTMSGLINNVSDSEFLYWILTNCDGMDEEEIVKFIEGLVVNHVAKAGHGDEGSRVDAHKAEVPVQATAEALTRLEAQLYHDFMGLRVEDISAGSVTATQIQAAYEPLNQKTDQFESCVTDFIVRLLELIGIDDEPTYTRSQMSNQAEQMELVLQAAEYLDDEYITTKILTILGDADKVEDVLKRKMEESSDQYRKMTEEEADELE